MTLMLPVDHTFRTYRNAVTVETIVVDFLIRVLVTH